MGALPTYQTSAKTTRLRKHKALILVDIADRSRDLSGLHKRQEVGRFIDMYIPATF